MTGFKLRGTIHEEQLIATRGAVRTLERLKEAYGIGRWREFRGKATVELANGGIVHAELHWYHAHGIGRKEMKIKRLLD